MTAIGVDIGGTKLLAGVVGDDLEVRQRVQHRVAGLPTDALLDLIGTAIGDVIAASNQPVSAVGFGIPCTFDRGVAVQAVHLPLTGVPFARVMAERLRLPVAVDNDANCAALAEARHGAARDARHAVMLTIGTGIGGGLILDGSLYRGAQGAGAELGHMVIDEDGPPCNGNCPSRGCLEAYVSGSALQREAALAVGSQPDTPLGRALEEGEPLDGPLVTRLAEAGDPVAGEVIGRMARHLGAGLASIVNIFNPDVIVVGGGVIGAGELLLGPARAVVRERALPPGRDHVRVVAAEFGPEAGMLGAALLAEEELALGTAVQA